jgi:glycine dehydrogenase subunit 1
MKNQVGAKRKGAVRYIPNTQQNIDSMLKEIGVKTVDELFCNIPDDLLFKGRLKLPEPLTELELLKHMEGLSRKNANAAEYTSFLGGGIYHHFIPSVVKNLTSRSEFYTSYTPYQPEISQGTLQAMFEFQTFICLLTGMDVSNASMYDGATSTAEAVLMALRIRKKSTVLVSRALHPEYVQVIKTYCNDGTTRIVEVPLDERGRTDKKAVKEEIDDDTACLVLQSPNFFGVIEDLESFEKIVHPNNVLLLSAFTEPIAFGMLKPPGDYNADVVCGEGQSLGVPQGFGGPALGILTAKKEYIRNMPGRIVGKGVDGNGNRAFVLTLSAREQHIRREKATSNICTNEGLCALTATIFLCCLGKRGLRNLSLLNHKRAEYAKKKLIELPGVDLKFMSPTFNEFVVRTEKDPDEIVRGLSKRKILAGIPLGRFFKEFQDCMLVTVTEMNSREDIDILTECLGGL